jgi:hypothetical protein
MDDTKKKRLAALKAETAEPVTTRPKQKEKADLWEELALNKLVINDLRSKTLKFTVPQRLKIYGMIEGWRQELKIVELGMLQAEERIEEAPAHLHKRCRQILRL